MKPRCFLSIRDYASAASGTLPHSKSGHGIYDKADGTPGSGTGPGMGRLGSGTGARPPLKLSVGMLVLLICYFFIFEFSGVLGSLATSFDSNLKSDLNLNFCISSI